MDSKEVEQEQDSESHSTDRTSRAAVVANSNNDKGIEEDESCLQSIWIG
jgi:hypothetical protein